MNKYIDADMLIKKYIDTDIEKFSNSDIKIVLENLKQNILKAPSLDLVRCGECIRWEDGRVDFSNCKLMGIVKPDGFCSEGKRRESEYPCKRCKHRKVPKVDYPCEYCYEGDRYEPQTEKADRIPYDPLVEMNIKRMIEERLRQTEREDE